MEVEVASTTLAGQKRKYMDAAQIEETKHHGEGAEVDSRFGSSTARMSTEINSYYSQLINGLEQQKRRKLQPESLAK